MTESGEPNLEDCIDRYVRGELTPAEARELAQASLDSPDLFEELTDSALAQAALASAPVPARVVRFPRKARFIIFGVAAAAAAAFGWISLVNIPSSSVRHEQPVLTQNQSAPKPGLAFSAQPGEPVLLASGLQPASAGRDGAPVFRSPEPASRAPQAAGSILSIEDGVATISLGSLDGLAKGSELPVFRDARSAEPIGRLLVTTVFRERARGRMLAGPQIQMNHQVRVPAPAHLGVLLEQVDALSSRGDADAARNAAEQAVLWAETPNVSSAQRAQALNTLAVLLLLRGDYDGAEAPLSRVISSSPKTDIAYRQSTNNLGVLAELRGDRRKAEAFYADALRAYAAASDSPPQEHRAVETNLARIRGLH